MQAYWNGPGTALNQAAPRCMAGRRTPIAASRGSAEPGFRATRWHRGTGQAPSGRPLPASYEAMIIWAMTALMACRLARASRLCTH